MCGNNSIKCIKWAFYGLLIMILTQTLLGCEKEDLECKCDLQVTIDGNGYYTVTGVPTDCNFYNWFG